MANYRLITQKKHFRKGTDQATELEHSKNFFRTPLINKDSNHIEL